MMAAMGMAVDRPWTAVDCIPHVRDVGSDDGRHDGGGGRSFAAALRCGQARRDKRRVPLAVLMFGLATSPSGPDSAPWRRLRSGPAARLTASRDDESVRRMVGGGNSGWRRRLSTDTPQSRLSQALPQPARILHDELARRHAGRPCEWEPVTASSVWAAAGRSWQ